MLAVLFFPFSLLLGFIISKWDEISAFFSGVATWFADFFRGVWDTIVAIFTPVVQFFSDMFSQAWTAICDVWNAAAGFFGDVWNKVVGVFQAVGTWFGDRFREAWENVKRVFAPVGQFFQDMWNTIVNKFTTIGTAVGNAIGGAVKSVVNGIISGAEKSINFFIGLINGAAGIINNIPGVHIPKVPEVHFGRLAKGTEHAEGGRYLVGENGPEMVTLPRGAKVMPAQRTENYLKENRERGNININIDAKIYKDTDAYQLASRIGYLVSQA